MTENLNRKAKTCTNIIHFKGTSIYFLFTLFFSLVIHFSNSGSAKHFLQNDYMASLFVFLKKWDLFNNLGKTFKPLAYAFERHLHSFNVLGKSYKCLAIKIKINK